MTRVQRTITDEASDAFWAAVMKAVELDDLAGFKEAVCQLRQVSPAAAIAIAETIEADEELEKALPIIRWLVAALRGDVASVLH